MPETIHALPYSEAEFKEIYDLALELGCSVQEAASRLAIAAFKAGLNRDYQSQTEPERLAKNH